MAAWLPWSKHGQRAQSINKKPMSTQTKSPVLPASIRAPSTRDLNDLYYFAKVVDEKGFSAAGRALNISKSHLSRRIAALEERLGMRLLQRSTRKLSPTQAGEIYLKYCHTIVQAARDADEHMLGLLAEPTGQVTVSSPIGLAQTVFPLLLPEFLKQHPKVSVRLHITGDTVDLYRDQVDIAMQVSLAMPEDSSLVSRRLGTSELSLVASKDYLRQHGTPSRPEDLANHSTLMSMGVMDQGPHEWQLHDKQGGHVVVMHHPRLLCGDLQLIFEAVRQNQGIALLPDTLWRTIDTDHRLVQVLPEWRVPEGIIHAVYASRRGMVPAVRELLDYLAEKLTAMLEDNQPFWQSWPNSASAASEAKTHTTQPRLD